MGSSIENDLKDKGDRIRYLMRTHDRGVVAGFLLSIFPLFPISTVGLLITLYNKQLLSKGKLDTREQGPVRLALIIACITTPIGIILLYIMSDLLSYIMNETIFDIIFLIPNIVIDLVDFLLGFGDGQPRGVTA